MRVLVDAVSLYPHGPGSGPTGVGRWTMAAVRELARSAPTWKIELLAIHRWGAGVRLPLAAPNITQRQIRFSSRATRWLQVARLLPPLERWAGRFDAVIGPGFVTLPASHGAEIPVVHDLTYLRYPTFVARRNLHHLRRVMPAVLRRAAVVVTVSDAVREELIGRCGVDRARIVVAPGGCDPAAFAAGGPRPRNVPDRYLLAVGTLEPRKNLPGVLAAHNLLRASRPDAPPLVIAGAAGWRTGGLSDELRKLSEGGSVRWLGYVDDAELKALYTHAAGLLFCPFYEGFGLPVLEAMAAGCPVIATDRGAVREVAGDAALLVDPAAAGEIATAAARLLDEPALRARLVNGGRARAAAYPWRQTGERLREAVEQAVELKRAAGATPR